MKKFDCAQFLRILCDTPALLPPLEMPEHSEYLQTQVIEKLEQGSGVDFQALDWEAFELRHVTPEEYAKAYAKAASGWAQGFNGFLRKTPAVPRVKRIFF